MKERIRLKDGTVDARRQTGKVGRYLFGYVQLRYVACVEWKAGTPHSRKSRRQEGRRESGRKEGHTEDLNENGNEKQNENEASTRKIRTAR